MKKSDERKRRKLKWGREGGKCHDHVVLEGFHSASFSLSLSGTLAVLSLVPRIGSGNGADILMWIRKRKRKRTREEGVESSCNGEKCDDTPRVACVVYATQARNLGGLLQR